VLWKSEAEMVEKLNRLAFQADWLLNQAPSQPVLMTTALTPRER
jgi:hypothetical protein